LINFVDRSQRANHYARPPAGVKTEQKRRLTLFAASSGESVRTVAAIWTRTLSTIETR